MERRLAFHIKEYMFRMTVKGDAAMPHFPSA